jgi:hypothetical protein
VFGRDLWFKFRLTVDGLVEALLKSLRRSRDPTLRPDRELALFELGDRVLLSASLAGMTADTPDACDRTAHGNYVDRPPAKER